jgi:uncharacterized protein with LGFP repeats
MGSLLWRRRAALSAAAALCLAAPGLRAQPTPDTPTAPQQDTCSFRLGAAALAEWAVLGGKDGRLGCPTADESDTVPSASGARSRVVPFGQNGAIVTWTSGVDAGIAYAVIGCTWRLFFSYGGAGGWLGLPLEEAQNTPDGQVQKFEGGTVTSTRAFDSCDAEPPGTSS